MKGVAALLLLATGTNAITLKSDPMFSSLGYETRHYKGEGDYDDYTVPNFGRDTDVVTTLKNAADAEKKQGHFWDVLAPTPDDPPRNYFVPHFGADNDMIETKRSIATAEAQEGHQWTWKAQHLLDHLKNPVPPGMNPDKAHLDEDIDASLKNTADAEKTLGAKWTGDGQYV